MFTEEIQALLRQNLSRLSLPVPAVIAERSLRGDIDDIVATVLSGARPAVVCDADTEAALGAAVFRALKGRFSAVRVRLDGVPCADRETAERVRRLAGDCDALIAVGGGTINDLCKFAAHEDGKPYIVFPTAASMNGYLSANASITTDGYKHSHTACMPAAVLCDLSVIAAAPERLAKAGLGDCLARPTAQADWLLSHLLLDTAYDDTPFALLRSCEAALFDSARGIARVDADSIRLLLETLLLSGLGMTLTGGSHPASQGEHIIAHAYAMLPARRPREGGNPGTLHGEEIGVTALAMARMQEKILRSPPPLWKKIRKEGNFAEERLAALFGAHITGEARKTYAAKRELMEQKLDSRLRGNPGEWESIAARIEKIMLPPGAIQAILRAAEAPDTPEALGWEKQEYDIAAAHARFLRDRFTFLDLQS